MTPLERLHQVVARADAQRTTSFVKNITLRSSIESVTLCPSNRAAVRLLLACLIAKLDNSRVDPRKPYTEIGGTDSFSGRAYDEADVSQIVSVYRLPCNPTTAFLTPAFRTFNRPLTKDVQLEGRPKQLYTETLAVLDHVATKKVQAKDVLAEIVRVLLNMRDEREARLRSLTSRLNIERTDVPLSQSEVFTLIQQHLACKNASRLPVLVIAALYETHGAMLGERCLPLNAHQAADEQTGAVGDVEITLANDANVFTVYEAKSKPVERLDLERALQKLATTEHRVAHYVFVTTDRIDLQVQDYARSLYHATRGTEFAIVDCLGFLQHVLLLFHKHRIAILDAYQRLVLAEPDSAVRQELKEAFLTLRLAAEASEA